MKEMEQQLNELLDTVLEQDTFSEDVKRQVEWVIADTVISALYGLKSEKEIVNFINDKSSTVENGEERYPILGTNLVTNRKDNLIIHGTAIVSNELDEGNTFAKGHPSAHILPTLLVSAFENNATIDQVMDAYIKAYEISSRFSYASKMRDDMHPHGTWGNIGGAVARAIIEGKDKEAIKEIIMISLTLPLSTAWLAAEKGQSVRNLYTGVGSLLAYESVDFQAYGFASNLDVVENIWTNIMGNGNKINADLMTEALMDPPLITQNYFKVHPSCRFTHAAIDATLELVGNHTFDEQDIDEVTVETYSLAARCNTNKPTTKLQSKFSIPYAVASTLLGVNMYDDYRQNLSKVEQLVDRVVVQESEELTNLLADNKRAAKVQVKLKDGKVLEHTVETAQGEFTHRFTKKQMFKKYESMLADYPSDFVAVLKENLLDLRKCSTFKEWLHVNQLMEGVTWQK